MDQEHQTPHIKRWQKCLIIFLIVLGLLLGGLGAGYMYLQTQLGKIQYDDTTENNVQNDLDIDWNQIPGIPEGEAAEDKDVVNILLLGTDERTPEFSDSARADSIMVLSLNTRFHTIKLVSIERGIGVPVPGRNDDWITHTFRYGGEQLVMDTVSQCFNLDLDGYVRVNFHIFTEAIDAIGGVEIEFTEEEAYYLNNDATYLHEVPGVEKVLPGLNKVNGATALCYARIRKIDSDWRRIERQRNVVQAAVDQVKTLDLISLNKLAGTILPMIKTNLTQGEITRLLATVPGFIAAGAEIQDMTIPVKGTYWGKIGVDGRHMTAVDFEENARILYSFFYYPYSTVESVLGIEEPEEEEPEKPTDQELLAADVSKHMMLPELLKNRPGLPPLPPEPRRKPSVLDAPTPTPEPEEGQEEDYVEEVPLDLSEPAAAPQQPAPVPVQ